MRPGGLVAASTFAEPGRVESAAVHEAMSALSPPQRQAAHAPYSLSEPGNLEAPWPCHGCSAGFIRRERLSVLAVFRECCPRDP